MQPLQTCIGPTIRIGRESWFLPYAGFFLQFAGFKGDSVLKNVDYSRTAVFPGPTFI